MLVSVNSTDFTQRGTNPPIPTKCASTIAHYTLRFTVVYEGRLSISSDSKESTDFERAVLSSHLEYRA